MPASLAKMHNFARLHVKPIFIPRSLLTAKPIETIMVSLGATPCTKTQP